MTGKTVFFFVDDAFINLGLDLPETIPGRVEESSMLGEWLRERCVRSY
jgi:hypothetical protein